MVTDYDIAYQAFYKKLTKDRVHTTDRHNV